MIPLFASPGPLLPLPVSLLLAVLMACSVAWLLAEIGRRYAGRGTRPRYVWASVEHLLRWPAMLNFLISIAVEIRWYGDPFLTFISCAGAACWLVLYREKRNGDDDDDFWKGLSKRLREGLGSPRTVTSGGGA